MGNSDKITYVCPIQTIKEAVLDDLTQFMNITSQMANSAAIRYARALYPNDKEWTTLTNEEIERATNEVIVELCI